MNTLSIGPSNGNAIQGLGITPARARGLWELVGLAADVPFADIDGRERILYGDRHACALQVVVPADDSERDDELMNAVIFCYRGSNRVIGLLDGNRFLDPADMDDLDRLESYVECAQ